MARSTSSSGSRPDATARRSAKDDPGGRRRPRRRQPTSADGLDLRRVDGHRVRCPPGPLDPPPGDEADHAEHAVDDVHDRRRVVAGREQQRDADQVDGDPDQPELDVPAGHPVGGQDRAGQDPGVGRRAPGAEGGQRVVGDGPEHDRRHQQLHPALPAGPGRCDAHAFAAARTGLPELVPAIPAVDADRQEEDLSGRLAVEVEVLGGVEHPAQEDREQQHVAHDADRPCEHLALHAEDGAGQAEAVPDDLPPEDAGSDIELGVQQPLQ